MKAYNQTPHKTHDPSGCAFCAKGVPLAQGVVLLQKRPLAAVPVTNPMMKDNEDGM